MLENNSVNSNFTNISEISTFQYVIKLKNYNDLIIKWK